MLLRVFVCTYILFVQDSVIPKKTVKIIPNEKPWITKVLKAKVLEKNKLFKEGKRLEGRTLKRDITKEIKKGKAAVKQKIEERFCSGNAKEAWEGIKTLTGTSKTAERHDAKTDEERKKHAEDLN